MEIQYIQQRLQSIANPIIFDIGACNFDDSMAFKSAFPNATVIAFEPDQDNLDDYASKAYDVGISIAPIALSDQDGATTFFPSDNLNGKVWRYSGSIMKPRMKPGSREGVNHPGLLFDDKGYEVQTVRLDTFCKLNSINRIDHIHIDVQGAEMKVLSAMGDLRPQTIFAETCEFDTYETGVTLESFDAFMQQLGYRVERRFEYDTLYEYGK